MLLVTGNLHFRRGSLAKSRSWWKPDIWKVVAANQPETLLLLPEMLSVVPELTETLSLTWVQTETKCPVLGPQIVSDGYTQQCLKERTRPDSPRPERAQATKNDRGIGAVAGGEQLMERPGSSQTEAVFAALVCAQWQG